jgi:hypothetical protein
MVFVLREPRSLRRAVAAVLVLMVLFAAAAVLAAWLWPATYEFVAFVEDGYVDKEPLVARNDLLDQLNGLGIAGVVAAELNDSPWRVWRRFWVTSEGPLLVIRVRHADPVYGTRLVEAARKTITAELKRRYDTVMAPQAAYIAGLRARLQQIESPAPERAGGAIDAGERLLTASTLHRAIRDAELFVSLAHEPSAVWDVRVRAPDRNRRAIRLAFSGAFVGFALGIAGVAVVTYRSRPERAVVEV